MSLFDSNPKRIGLLADSHGDLKSTEESIRVLRERGVDGMIHLGDFSDSMRTDTLGAIVDMLEANGILAVMGNNDFMVGNTLAEMAAHNGDPDRSRLAAFIKSVPMTRVLQDLCFAHSLPFEMFKSCYEPIDNGSTERAQSLFRETSHRILFCGHSHFPVLFRLRGGRVSRENVLPDRRISLDPSDRYIVVVGAVEEGECALYDLESSSYERIRIF
ncbi:MAG: metallophosphoesterase family protein [Deltaproteobacteria bacterium]|nr:metallophosphoesterase family protein [Deltaproteobacteria bacterium]